MPILNNCNINVLKSFTDRIFALSDDRLEEWVKNAELHARNRKIVQETIQSPTDKLLSTKEQLDQFPQEKFSIQATIEPKVNCSKTDALTSRLDTNNVINIARQIACAIPDDFFNDGVTSEPDTTTVAPNVVPEPFLSVPANTTNAGAGNISHHQHPINQHNQAENPEKSAESNVKANSRKRSLEVTEERNDHTDASFSKKKRQPSHSSTGWVSEKVVERRIKNNAASRVYRASRKTCHNKLFEQEKELSEENKLLRSKVKELTVIVEYLRNYLANSIRLTIGKETLYLHLSHSKE